MVTIVLGALLVHFTSFSVTPHYVRCGHFKM